MLNKSILELPNEPLHFNDVVPMDVHGYTLGRRIAIGIWLGVLLLFIVVTSMLFGMSAAGIDWFFHVDMKLMNNLQPGSVSRYQFNIPLVFIGQIVGFVLAVAAGIKAFIALFIPPAIRTHEVRVRMDRGSATETP